MPTRPLMMAIQVCHGLHLPAAATVSKHEALSAFQSGARRVISTLKFPEGLLLGHPGERPAAAAAVAGDDDGIKPRSQAESLGQRPPGVFRSAATCVSRIGQSVSGYRSQTRLTEVGSVDACCFACEKEPNCKVRAHVRACVPVCCVRTYVAGR